MADVARAQMGIAELAERAGVTQRTIRYYVSEGLLPPPAGRGQRRAYNVEHLQQLERIHALKSAYLPLHEIRRRLTEPSSAPSVEAPDAAPVAMGRERDGVATGRHLETGAAPSGAVAQTTVSTINRGPLGFGGQPEMGRIEIYEPVESVWRRHTIRTGVELHFQDTDDPALAEAIQRLIREAGRILNGNKKTSGHRA